MNNKEFKTLDINPQLIRAIKDMGFSRMTPIQEQTFQLIDPSERKKMHRIINSTNTEVQSIMLQDTADMDTDVKEIQSGSRTANRNKRSRPRRGHRKKNKANK